MLSIILEYISLFLQVAAAAIAISLFKRTKFNASWILISIGFLLMAVSRVFELWPTIYPEMEDQLQIVQRWLAFIISLVLLIGVFYIRKIFQFMRRVDGIRRESEKRVLAAVIRTEEQERQRFAKELHDGLGPLLSVIKMLVSGLDGNKAPEMNDKIKLNLRQAVDEAIAGVRNISANISPHILNNFGLRDAVEAFIKRLRQSEEFTVCFTTNLTNERFGYNAEVILYRVICELINNTLRHAAASRVSIDIQLEEGCLYLEYTDNGIGFDVQTIARHDGMGLNNMRYRLQSGNGDIEIVSEHGKGMRANAYIKV
ncbi:MAG: sensor histidine kinase [Odoribacter sp.]|nr:sensor histidine kinase [Odoribacter sp.]